jgi:hypothetical protein
MMNEYRIKKITKGDKVTFRPQRKFLWLWINLSYEYSHYDIAIYHINEDINNRNPMIEYLDVTPDELAPRTPNPPPKNP